MRPLMLSVLTLCLAVPVAAQKPQPRAAQLTMTVQVTDREGTPLPDVAVALAGPVERSGSTGEKGAVVFRTLRAGTYRLRFEHEGFITLEREVAIRAGQPATIAVALSPAPEPPAPPDPVVKPVEPEPEPVPDRVVEPRLLSIPDFLDKNLIGSEPQRQSVIACAQGGTARLVQVRDPLTDQRHADADEILYVVAGSGIVRIGNQETRVGPGHFALVPRGVPHGFRRDGRNPVIVLAVSAGAPCLEGGPAGP